MRIFVFQLLQHQHQNQSILVYHHHVVLIHSVEILTISLPAHVYKIISDRHQTVAQNVL